MATGVNRSTGWRQDDAIRNKRLGRIADALEALVQRPDSARARTVVTLLAWPETPDQATTQETP